MERRCRNTRKEITSNKRFQNVSQNSEDGDKGNAGSTCYSGPPEVFMRHSRYQSRFQDPGTKHSQDRIRSVLSVRKYNKIEKYWHELIVSLDIVTKATILT